MFIALAQHAKFHAVHTDACHVKAAEFGDANACGVEREQNHIVAVADIGIFEMHLIEETVHFCLADV